MGRIRNYNAMGLDLSKELPFTPDAHPLWTEYLYFFGYDENNGHGVSIHVGREPFDKAIWRATVTVYLPGQDLLVARCSGKDGHARGPGAGPLKISCIDPARLWTVEFDGAAQRTNRVAMAHGLIAGEPSESLAFALAFDAVGPLVGTPPAALVAQSWASAHWDQIIAMTGDISVRGVSHAISGVGVRDHSVGARDYAPVEGNMWLNVVFPSGRVLNAQYTRAGPEAIIRAGYIYHADDQPIELITLVDTPLVGSLEPGSVPADPFEDPECRNLHLVIESAKGRFTLEGELLHAAIVSFLPPSDEHIGTDFSRPDGLQLVEAPIRLRFDGEEGIGGRERLARIGALQQ